MTIKMLLITIIYIKTIYRKQKCVKHPMKPPPKIHQKSSQIIPKSSTNPPENRPKRSPESRPNVAKKSSKSHP